MMTRSGRMAALCVLLLAVTTILTGCPDPNIVIFADPDLEAAVRDEIGKPFGLLNRTELLDVVDLYAPSRGIDNLRGIENLQNLLSLDISNNNVSDLTPLTTLTNLTYINLNHNPVSNIAPLAGLFNLDFLEMADTQVWDLSPLVTNMLNGGLGPGDKVTVADVQTLDDDGNYLPTVAPYVALLEQGGVTVQPMEIIE